MIGTSLIFPTVTSDSNVLVIFHPARINYRYALKSIFLISQKLLRIKLDKSLKAFRFVSHYCSSFPMFLRDNKSTTMEIFKLYN